MRVLAWNCFQAALGQLKPIVQISWCRNGPIRGLENESFQSDLGQLDLTGMAKVFSSWANVSTPPGSYPANWKQ